MKDLKCKICGGSLEPLPNGDFRCDSCGAVVKKADLEERKQVGLLENAQTAKELLESGAFGSAYLIFENILTQKPQDADTRWNLLLCRYGVLYQLDELTGEKLPTVNRMRYESILEDPDYLAILKYAGEDQKKSYIRDAKHIADIQKRYLEIALKEEPYDVFISFKAENEDGTRSRDSVIGQEIYNQLTEHGLRVFYSRITLENKGGEEYEPYIFSALNTAKVMLLIGTSKDHVLAPWVANEWQRYLALMQEKSDKSFLPVYEGMELSEFPKEIPVREAADYSKQGALSELTQGVLSITGKGVLVEAKESRASIAKLSEGLRQAVEKGDFSHARELANAILDLDAENSDAYYYLLLAYYGVKKATALSNVDEPWTENRNYIRALKYADPARKQLLEAVKERREMRLQDERENRIQREEAVRRKKEIADAVRQGEKIIQQKKYQEAFELLSKVAAGDPQADRLIELSKKGMEAEALLSDPHFLDTILKQEHPDAYFKMEHLREASGEADPRGRAADIKRIATGIVAIILAFVLLKVLPAVVTGDGVLAFTVMTNGPILGIVLLLVGAVKLVKGLNHLVRSIREETERKKYREHMENVIGPLREATWNQIKKEYVPWLGEDFFQGINPLRK